MKEIISTRNPLTISKLPCNKAFIVLSTVSTDGIVTPEILLKALNGYVVLVRDMGVSWARLGNDLANPTVFVFNLSRQPRHYEFNKGLECSKSPIKTIYHLLI